MDKNKIYWVRGNTQELLIPLEQEIVPEEGEVQVVPFYPDQNATVVVRLVGKYRRQSYTPLVDGNLLRFTEDGTIPAGVYGVEILVNNPDGTQFRSLWDNQIVVTNANDSVLQEWDEFRQLDVKARAAVFFFSKGDPFTYDDFTPEQIAELKKPATDAAAEVAALEQNIEAAEALRVTAEQTRQQNETTRTTQETSRQNAEGTRQQNEQQRINQEQARQQNESSRTTTFNADHTTATSDHQTATSDHQTAAADHTTATSDNQTATSDHQTAAADHTRADNDHTLAGTDHETAAADHQTAISDHTASETATVAANTAAELATNKATEAGRVNATINGTILTVTDRNGHSSSVNTKGEKGDPAANVNATLNGSVVTITDKDGNSNSIDLLDATEERVQITVTAAQDAPQGTTVSGLVINAYYNDASVPTATVTTDANGMAVLRVPNGYKYRLVFPSQTGCRQIADVVHTAAVSQRSVEVEYMAAAQPGDSEHVIVQLMDVDSALAGTTVTLTYDGTSSSEVTDSAGKAEFYVPLGKTYTVTVPQREGYYIVGNSYTKTFTASGSVKAMDFIYRVIVSGVFVVPSDGTEYTFDEWKAAVQAGTRQNSEALYIKFATSELIQAGGTFCFDIDMLRERTYESKEWSNMTAQAFTSIPLMGDNVNQPYYYDGLTATQLVKAESVERGVGWEVPAFDAVLAQTRTIGGQTAQGFLMSVGQWSIAWNARYAIDDILTEVRPNGTYLFSSLTANKWTCTQHDNQYVFTFSTSVNQWYSGYKKNKNLTIPAFSI